MSLRIVPFSALAHRLSVFFRTVKPRIFGLPNISTVAAMAVVLIYDSRTGKERDLVHVGCEKRYICRLNAHTKSYKCIALP